MNINSFLTNLDGYIQSKHLLTNPFYLAWTKGELSLECLQEYAKEYYHHVSAFPTYLSALHSHTKDSFTRKQLLQNLIEEEAGSPNHPDLWRTFANNLGVSDSEIDAHQPSLEMATLIKTFQDICLHNSVSEGLASLYSYESQIPAICESKIEGLKTHYNLRDPKGWAYFTVHIAADKEHAEVERQLLAQHVTDENAHSTLDAAQKVLNCLWDFLISLCNRFNIHCEAK